MSERIEWDLLANLVVTRIDGCETKNNYFHMFTYEHQYFVCCCVQAQSGYQKY